MASENTAPDDGPAPDPFETELVAYLDGELDPAAARQVEARLAKDPAARTRAAELKRSFDMLDYLPRPEPSPTFTTRTLDRLPVLKPAANGTGSAQPTAAARPTASRSGPGATNGSTSMPISLEVDEAPEPRAARPRRFLRAAGIVAAVSAFAALGYLAAAVARPYLFPARDREGEAKGEVESRVVEHLPLYAVADDLAFVAELAKPEYFGDDPAVSFDPGLKVPPADASDKPTGRDMEALTKAFRALPPARRAEVVALDRDLHAKEPRERDRLFRALEAYAVWLERLPESERRGVLAQDTSGLRLGVVRKVREQQWWDALPPAVRAKPELLPQWREEEAARRDRWAFVRRHAEAFAANKSPWPFDTEAGRKEVTEFARAAFKTDDPKRCRLAPDELAEYKRLLAVAERDGAWAWYGLFVYEMSGKAHPYLPEPADLKLMYTDMSDLPDQTSRTLKKFAGGDMRAVAGKWPEFPLEAHRRLQIATKFGLFPPLGPARLSDFKEPLRVFAEKELLPRMTGDEKRDLERFQGRWPEYPQRFVGYAHKYDLPVPGVTLPFSPKLWDQTYGTRTAPRPTN